MSITRARGRIRLSIMLLLIYLVAGTVFVGTVCGDTGFLYLAVVIGGVPFGAAILYYMEQLEAAEDRIIRRFV